MRQAVDEYIMLASDHMKKLKKAKEKKKRDDAVLEGMVSEAFNNSGPKQVISYPYPYPYPYS